jgi:hypothetical protein
MSHDEVIAAAGHPVSRVCQHCGKAEAEPGNAMPLCGACRESLAQRPFPGWIRFSAVVVVALLAAAIIDLPASLRAGIAFKRGKRAEARGNFAAAIDEYKTVFDSFPSSTVVAVRLVVVCCRAGRPDAAAGPLQALQGKKLPQQKVGEVNRAIDELRRKQQQPGQQQPGQEQPGQEP